MMSRIFLIYPYFYYFRVRTRKKGEIVYYLRVRTR